MIEETAEPADADSPMQLAAPAPVYQGLLQVQALPQLQASQLQASAPPMVLPQVQAVPQVQVRPQSAVLPQVGEDSRNDGAPCKRTRITHTQLVQLVAAFSDNPFPDTKALALAPTLTPTLTITITPTPAQTNRSISCLRATVSRVHVVTFWAAHITLPPLPAENLFAPCEVTQKPNKHGLDNVRLTKRVL